MTDAVFGYGSLVADLDAGRPAVLHGTRRAWTVAMDNTVDLPDYKHYVAADGSRPDVAVAFLDLREGDGDVGGVLVPATSEHLAALDRRERQYRRLDVTDRVSEAVTGRVWTYVGRTESRERARRARAQGRLVVARAYLEAVAAAFEQRDDRDAFDTSTDPVDVPVWDLRRVDG